MRELLEFCPWRGLSGPGECWARRAAGRCRLRLQGHPGDNSLLPWDAPALLPWTLFRTGKLRLRNVGLENQDSLFILFIFILFEKKLLSFILICFVLFYFFLPLSVSKPSQPVIIKVAISCTAVTLINSEVKARSGKDIPFPSKAYHLNEQGWHDLISSFFWVFFSLRELPWQVLGAVLGGIRRVLIPFKTKTALRFKDATKNWEHLNKNFWVLNPKRWEDLGQRSWHKVEQISEFQAGFSWQLQGRERQIQ